MDDDFERDDSDPLAWMDYVPEFADFTYPRKRVPGIQAEINNLAKHLNLVELSPGQIVSARSWERFELAYEYIGESPSCPSLAEMADKAHCLRAVCDGELEDIHALELEKCYAVALYSLNHGLKMTALASSLICADKKKRKAAIQKLQRESFKFSWMEAAGKAEQFALSQGGMRYRIAPELIREKVYPHQEIIIEEDNLHYRRIPAPPGKEVRKIALGTIRL